MKRTIWAGIAIGLAGAGVLLALLYLRAGDFSDRVYRVGWMISPPFQVRGADGKPSGISVELLNQAARRRGIRLDWVYWANSSESALTGKKVDLWPLITVTPERLKKFHISEPYLQHEYCLLVRADTPVTRMEELASARIGMANPSIDAYNLRLVLPEAVPVSQTSAKAALVDVCRRNTDAAFMDRFTAVEALLGEHECDGQGLRWIPIPQLHAHLGVGSTFEAKDAADALRQEIGVLAEEGQLARIFEQWGYMAGQDATSVKALVDARRRESRLIVISVVFALMFLLACLQTFRVWREKSRTLVAEKALRESQERYLQAQKMESIGRLAGGVAHDFNNLLTVINGYSDLIYNKLLSVDPLRPYVDEIRRAGAHAAELTQQLLAFSRKQVGRPHPINLNSVVTEAQKMLRRLLGEDILLVTRLDPELGLIMADPGYIHQIVVNLSVNARDAMPDGGTLSIETANGVVDGAEVVVLSVSDTGVGMEEEVRANIFEPFFTTKGAKGTGLGLATVYGIVQQCHGTIEVSSRPGKGSTFRIQMPRVQGAGEPAAVKASVSVRGRGEETVLVVEDQNDVRGFAVQALARYGYNVLEAADADAALALADRHAGKIDVLLTDVVLPGMNGRELADRFQVLRPGTKIIYTSGYTQDLIADRGVLPRDLCYLPKPYTADEISTKVREAIEAQ